MRIGGFITCKHKEEDAKILTSQFAMKKQYVLKRMKLNNAQ